MKARALNLRIARLTIDQQLAGRGGLNAEALAEAVRAELAAAADAGHSFARAPSPAVSGEASHLARSIATAVAAHLPAAHGIKP